MATNLDTMVMAAAVSGCGGLNSKAGRNTMHARVTTAHVQPGKMDDSLAIWRDTVPPVVKAQSGFKGALFLIDRNTGKGMSVTLWETEADLKAVEASGVYHEVIAKFADVLAGPPVREQYEVGVQV